MFINRITRTSIIITVIVGFLSIGTTKGINNQLKIDKNKTTSASSGRIIDFDKNVEEFSGEKSQRPANVQAFISYKYIDPMAGVEAFRLLIPKGWQAKGSITWVANPALPAQSQFRFHNPDGTEELNFFPSQSYFWTNNQVFLYTNPPGSLRFGTLVAEPIDLRKAFSNIIIPNFRANVSSLKIIETKEVPELAKLAKGEPTPGVNALATGGKIRIEYQENGKLMEEEIYAAVSQFITYLPASNFTSSYFINYWYIDYIFSFKAGKGKLDAQSKTFQTMIYSLKVNPQWFAKVTNVKELMVQMIMEGIHAIGRIGNIIAKAGSEMRADQQRAWEQRQQAQDRIAQNFSDYIRGVERYHDPFSGKQVELPNDYGYAWANNLGEYIVTDSPSYNPNIGSNLHWEQLQRSK
jgi:hypothetical protein